MNRHKGTRNAKHKNRSASNAEESQRESGQSHPPTATKSPATAAAHGQQRLPKRYPGCPLATPRPGALPRLFNTNNAALPGKRAARYT